MYNCRRDRFLVVGGRGRACGCTEYGVWSYWLGCCEWRSAKVCRNQWEEWARTRRDFGLVLLHRYLTYMKQLCTLICRSAALRIPAAQSQFVHDQPHALSADSSTSCRNLEKLFCRRPPHSLAHLHYTPTKYSTPH